MTAHFDDMVANYGSLLRSRSRRQRKVRLWLLCGYFAGWHDAGARARRLCYANTFHFVILRNLNSTFFELSGPFLSRTLSESNCLFSIGFQPLSSFALRFLPNAWFVSSKLREDEPQFAVEAIELHLDLFPWLLNGIERP